MVTHFDTVSTEQVGRMPGSRFLESQAFEKQGNRGLASEHHQAAGLIPVSPAREVVSLGGYGYHQLSIGFQETSDG
jgi:hypothetical protein